MNQVRIQLVDSGFVQLPSKDGSLEKQELKELWEEIKSLNSEKRKSKRKMKILFSKIELLEKRIEQWERGTFYFEEKKEELDSTIASLKKSLDEFYDEYDRIFQKMIDTKAYQDWLSEGPLREEEIENLLQQEIANEKWLENQESIALQRKIEQYKKKLTIAKRKQQELKKNYVDAKNLHITEERYEHLIRSIQEKRNLSDEVVLTSLFKQGKGKKKTTIEYLYLLPADYQIYFPSRILLASPKRVERLLNKSESSVLKIVGPTKFHNYTPEITPEDMKKTPEEISEEEWDKVLKSLVSNNSEKESPKVYS
ncbi:MAG: hypothetical protein IJI60_01385 [Bacilli bacterium]|nr:hypothetical protein [Bacilli bacterium]